jgi:hypothetical protein
MRSGFAGFAQDQERATARPAPETSSSFPALPVSGREIPYDYVAKFILEGVKGRRQQDVISISIEGAFVATAIGYGFLPKTPSLANGIGGSVSTPIAALAPRPVQLPASLGELVAEVAATALATRLASTLTIDKDEARAHVAAAIGCLFRHACGIDFKYSIVDSGSGRELQNQPILNIAGLGRADGDRPFRPFPKPMMFLPRSTIRIEVEEVSEGPLYAGAELQIVLHGYKMLGAGT